MTDETDNILLNGRKLLVNDGVLVIHCRLLLKIHD
jgi:hypothetical protein